MISVCGPNDASDTELKQAFETGRLIAESGHALVCGGRGGVMEQAAAGARSAGGATIGILPSYDASEANGYIDHAIPTGLGHARNAIVVASGEAVIAIGGGFGTLSEIGLALKMGKQVVHIGSWELSSERLQRYQDTGARYREARTPEEAVAIALDRQYPLGSGHG